MTRRAIEGDPDALQLLLASHYDRLLAVARRSMPAELKDAVEPADVVQETRFRAARGISGLRSEEPEAVFGWLAAIARNTILKLLESHRAAKRGGGANVSLEDIVVSASERPQAIVALDDGLSELARIEPRKAQVVEMRYFGGLSNAEMAEALDVSVPTIVRDLRFAEAWLRQYLARP